METIKKCKPSDGMKTQMSSSFSRELGCITDATDEEQDDLPYDGDVEITCKYNYNSGNLNDCTCTKDIPGTLNLACSEGSKNMKARANDETHPQPEAFSSHHRDARGTMGISVKIPESEATFKKESPVGSSSKADSKEHLTYSKISSVLWRHLPKGELISTCQLIECETIPETSFTESIDDTGNKPEPSEHIKGPSAHQPWATNLEEHHLEEYQEVNTGDQKQNSINEYRCVSEKPISSTGKCECRQEDLQLVNANEDTHIFQETKESTLLKKTVSPEELQGQAPYSLHAFSRVASEAPKSDNINSIPTIENTKSTPVLLSKSLTVNNTLENRNYFNSEVENQEDVSIPELLQQLEMMLIHHAGTQNQYTDQLRLNPKVLPQSEFSSANTGIYSGGTGTASEVFTFYAPIPTPSTCGLSKARLQCGIATALPGAGTAAADCINPSNILPELTLGEKMSQILRDQTDQLLKKVEDFSKHMTQDAFLQDNYLALNQLKGYLDALEKNYLTAREEHRNLQLHNCKDKSINLGDFDPERKLEGEIFRLGMLLEDLQEQGDDSRCNFSLLTSSESAHSSYSLFESSPVSSIADPPERRGIENAFLHENNEEDRSQTTDGVPQTDSFSLEGNKCNVCLHINTDIQERKTGTCSLFIQRKPTDLSDTNLSSDSEYVSTWDSYSHSQSKNFVSYKTESCKTFDTRLFGERKVLRCRCPRGSRDQFKLRNYKESAQSCALCRNKCSGPSSYSQKRISTQKSQKNKQLCLLLNRLSERQNFEAAKTCCSSAYDTIIPSHQYLPSKKPALRKSAVNIRNRNASDSNAKQVLSSALDHAIQTANSLKKATERMVQAVSEDLAKVKRKQL